MTDEEDNHGMDDFIADPKDRWVACWTHVRWPKRFGSEVITYCSCGGTTTELKASDEEMDCRVRVQCENLSSFCRKTLFCCTGPRLSRGNGSGFGRSDGFWIPQLSFISSTIAD